MSRWVLLILSVWQHFFSPLCCSVQPEELTLLLIKLRRQQAELNSLREHTVAQLMALGMEGPNPKVSTGCIHNMCVCMHAYFVLYQTSIESPIFSVLVCVCKRGGSLCISGSFIPNEIELWCVLQGFVSNRQ